ncbi:MAG: SDR family oxidoreductase [Acidobacteria bacterium]|nr:SDR family oxidoreductase [Acidobacteriota bacterium]
MRNQYHFNSRVIVVTGGAGVLCRPMAAALAGCHANVAIVDLQPGEVERWSGGDFPPERIMILEGDVLRKESMERAAQKILQAWGRIDGLINGAGGNRRDAATGDAGTFFDLPEEALRFVSDLNLLGTVIPCQVFGKRMAWQNEGVILNVSSMNAFRPLTRIPAYSAAKAAVSNFTQWLAVHMAQEYSPNIRVNAVAPGFFLTEQNRFLLADGETGEWTERGRRILDHTPMGRFGTAEDLLGAVLWLLSPMSRFVTGIVLPVDGGFSAYSGV